MAWEMGQTILGNHFGITDKLQIGNYICEKAWPPKSLRGISTGTGSDSTQKKQGAAWGCPESIEVWKHNIPNRRIFHLALAFRYKFAHAYYCRIGTGSHHKCSPNAHLHAHSVHTGYYSFLKPKYLANIITLSVYYTLYSTKAILFVPNYITLRLPSGRLIWLARIDIRLCIYQVKITSKVYFCVFLHIKSFVEPMILFFKRLYAFKIYYLRLVLIEETFRRLKPTINT